jgi:hypothetical protein
VLPASLNGPTSTALVGRTLYVIDVEENSLLAISNIP